MNQAIIEESQKWYRGIARFRNYYEKAIEAQTLKLSKHVFADFYCFKCKYPFTHSTEKPREPDLMLISKRFDSWYLVELELSKPSGFAHTMSQLTVFTAPNFDASSLTNFVVDGNVRLLEKFKASILKLFSNNAPNVLVILDSSNSNLKSAIEKKFIGNVTICSIEVYQDFESDYNMYILNGDIPFVSTKWSALIPNNMVPNIFTVEDRSIFNSLLPNRTVVLSAHGYGAVKGYLIPDSNKLALKIVEHPFAAGKQLKVQKDLAGNFVVKYQM